MGWGAIVRRKLIPNKINNNNISRLDLGHIFESRAAHKNHNSSISHFSIEPHNSQFVRYASCTSKQESSNVAAAAFKLWNTFLGIGHTLKAGLHMTSNDWAIKWSECKIVYFTIMVHYRLGKKLLRADVNITKRLLVKISEGKCLRTRERHLLATSMADIFRLLPGSMYIAVPSIQFLLPLLLKLYPNMLPSTFREKITGQQLVKRKLRAQTEYAKFLQETAIEMTKVAQNSPGGPIKPMADEFLRFWTDIRFCRPVSNEQIFRFAKLFSDQLTLDNLSRPLLVNMCKSMGITPFGTDEYVRFILREKLTMIKNEDKLIQSKGMEMLSEPEVHKACRERGIHVAEEMQQQLRDWLDLSLNHAIPSSLLIISRVFTMTKKLKPEEAILATLSSLPHELIYIVGVVSLPCNDPSIDKRRKLKYLELQEKAIKEEEEKELSDMKQFDAVQNDEALKVTTVSTPEQARARSMDKQEQLCELLGKNVSTECDKLLRLVNKEINLYSSYQRRKGPEGEKEAIKDYRAAQEENGKDAELDVGDNVSSALINRANGMLRKLEKETDGVDSNISYHWRVLERYCDGKVSPDVVAAATFLKDTVDKEGILELMSNLSIYKEGIMKLGAEAEDIDQGQNQLVRSGSPLDY